MMHEFKSKCDLCNCKKEARLFHKQLELNDKPLAWVWLCSSCWDLCNVKNIKKVPLVKGQKVELRPPKGKAVLGEVLAVPGDYYQGVLVGPETVWVRKIYDHYVSPSQRRVYGGHPDWVYPVHSVKSLIGQPVATVKNWVGLEVHPTDAYVSQTSTHSVVEQMQELRQVWNEALQGNAESLEKLLEAAYAKGLKEEHL